MGADVASIRDAFARGDFAAAVAPLQRAMALAPGDPVPARALGIVYARLERWADAVGVLGPIVADLEEPARALYLSAAVDCGEAGDAVARFEAADGCVTSAPDVLCEYGRALCAVGRLGDAEAV